MWKIRANETMARVPKWHVKIFPWHPAFTALPHFQFLFSDLHLYTPKKICVCVCVCVCMYVCVYIYIYVCVCA